MTTLTDFLLARITEDEARIHRAAIYLKSLHAHDTSPGLSLQGELVWTVRGARAECSAKRSIIASTLERCRIMGKRPEFSHDLRVLGAIYADHPDYLPEWRP